MIAIDHSRYVLVALRHGAKFRGEARLVLFLLPRCGFPVVCYSQQFSRALSQNKKTEELVRTERLPLQSIRCTCISIDLRAAASRSRLCRPGPGRSTAHAACLLYACVRFVRGKSSDAVWPGLEAYRRWSPFLHRLVHVPNLKSRSSLAPLVQHRNFYIGVYIRV